MVRVNLRKALVLYLSWLAGISAAIVLMLSDILPFRLSFVRPDTLFVCMTQCQVFFVVMIWPLFVPSIMTEEAEPAAQSGQVHLALLQICLLLIFSLPLALICSNVSGVTLATFARGQALVAALAGFVGILYSFAKERGWTRVGPWYFAAALAISAGAPFVAFLSGSSGGADLGFLAAVSPFWGALEVDQGISLVQAGLYAALGLILLGWDAFFRVSAARES